MAEAAQSLCLLANPAQGAGGADEVACRDNEMAYMFYYNLGGSFASPKIGTQTAVGGEQITNIQSLYWTGTELNSDNAWNFNFNKGNSRGARYGFPLSALRFYLPRLIAQQRDVMLIAERDEYLTGVKTRIPAARYEPLARMECIDSRCK